MFARMYVPGTGFQNQQKDAEFLPITEILNFSLQEWEELTENRQKNV